MRKDIELLRDLRIKVAMEIEQYQYRIPEDSIGKPWSKDKVFDELQAMREALVDPYWTEVELSDSIYQIELGHALKQTCAVVADDRCGHLLLWDPQKDEFSLAQRVSGDLLSSGVRGDAVGCFLAR